MALAMGMEVSSPTQSKGLVPMYLSSTSSGSSRPSPNP